MQRWQCETRQGQAHSSKCGVFQMWWCGIVSKDVMGPKHVAHCFVWWSGRRPSRHLDLMCVVAQWVVEQSVHVFQIRIIRIVMWKGIRGQVVLLQAKVGHVAYHCSLVGDQVGEWCQGACHILGWWASFKCSRGCDQGHYDIGFHQGVPPACPKLVGFPPSGSRR